MHRDSKMLLCSAPIAHGGRCNAGGRSKQVLRIGATRPVPHHMFRLGEKRCRFAPTASDRQTLQNEREAAGATHRENRSGGRDMLPGNRQT